MRRWTMLAVLAVGCGETAARDTAPVVIEGVSMHQVEYREGDPLPQIPDGAPWHVQECTFEDPAGTEERNCRMGNARFSVIDGVLCDGYPCDDLMELADDSTAHLVVTWWE